MYSGQSQPAEQSNCPAHGSACLLDGLQSSEAKFLFGNRDDAFGLQVYAFGPKNSTGFAPVTATWSLLSTFS